MAAGTTKHLGYLDGLRAVAALWVVVHHAWYTVQHQLHGTTASVLQIFSYGRLSVDLFIVLSGFCLMLPVLKNDGALRGGTIEFLKRRAWRILPPYYCAMALSLLLWMLFVHQSTGTLWDITMPVTLSNIGSHLVMLQDLGHDRYKINYVFWSIAVEWRIYFFFPLLLLGWKYVGPIPATILGLILSRELSFLSFYLFGATLTFEFLGLFAAGMLAAAIAFSPAKLFLRLHQLPWGWITLAGALMFVAGQVFHVTERIDIYVAGFWATAFVVMVSVKPEAWPHRMLGSRPLVFIGTFAYSIYLIHAPLLQMLWQYALIPLQPYPVVMLVVLDFIGVPLIVGVAYLFFLAFERPFLNRRQVRAEKAVPLVAPEKMTVDSSGLA